MKHEIDTSNASEAFREYTANYDNNHCCVITSAIKNVNNDFHEIDHQIARNAAELKLSYLL